MNAGRTLLAGRYQLGRSLGASAQGHVVKAYDRTTGRYVAVRLAPAKVAADPEARAGFLRAAREATRLDHPNIVPVFDLGEDRGMPFVVTELVEGRTMREALRTGGVPEMERALEIATQVCSALGAAHAQGLAHGGLSPGNVMGGGHSPVRVTDFGLAALVPAGTPQAVRYRSPEQVRRGRTDDRSDLYALGCCLFELLTGEAPFDGPTPFAVMRRHLSEPPRPPSAVRPEVPAELDELVLRCLAKYPHERPQTAAEIRHSLARLRPRPPAPSAAAPAAGPAEAAPPPAAPPPATRTAQAGPPPAARTAEAPPPAAPTAEAPPAARTAEAPPTGRTAEAPPPAAPTAEAPPTARTAEAPPPAARTAEAPPPTAPTTGEPEDGGAEATVPEGTGTAPPPGSDQDGPPPAPAELPPHEERVRALTRFAEPPRRRSRLVVVALAVGLAILVVAAVGLVAPGLVVDVGPGAASDATSAPAATTAPAPRPVPDLSGLARAEAARRLQAAGFQVGAVRLAKGTSLPKGLVVGTDPPAGATLKAAQVVALTVSNGSDPVTVGDLIGVIDEGPPSHIGPRGQVFRGQLVKLDALRGEQRRAAIADLLRIARAGASNGDFTPDFSRKAVEVLSRAQ